MMKPRKIVDKFINVSYLLKHFFIIALLYFGAVSTALAETLIAPQFNIDIQISKLPSKIENGYVVTGAYSSGDRFGIEGIAMIDGIIESHRYQGWDGLLITAPIPRIFYRKKVMINQQKKNWNDKYSRDQDLTILAQQKADVIQSHLLIKEGRIDVSQYAIGRKFTRRILFSLKDGRIGLWQSDAPQTLYDATISLKNEYNPYMALNLDMGAYDYCRKYIDAIEMECGQPNAGISALTNFISISTDN